MKPRRSYVSELTSSIVQSSHAQGKRRAVEAAAQRDAAQLADPQLPARHAVVQQLRRRPLWWGVALPLRAAPALQVAGPACF